MKRILCITFILIFILNLNVGLAVSNDYNQGKDDGILLGYKEGLLLKTTKSLLIDKIKQWNSANIINQENEEYIKGFIYGYEIGFLESSNYDEFKTDGTYYDGLQDGNHYAINLAKINAESHYLLGMIADSQVNFPSKNQLKEDFNLRKFPKDYIDGFLVGFEDGLDENSNDGYSFYYMKFYREFNNDYINLDNELGKIAGESLAKIKAENSAKMDRVLGYTQDWSRHKIKDFQLIKEYNLNIYSNRYIDYFINGFWTKFLEVYMNTFNDLYINEYEEKNHTEIIDIIGKENLTLADEKNIYIDIKAGTYYNPIALNIKQYPYNQIENKNNHIFSSNLYGIKVFNTNENMDLSKDIILKIRSYGNESKYNVLKYEDYKWTLVKSNKVGDFLEININPMEIQNKEVIYGVVVNSNSYNLYDIRGHWAKEEIEFLVRSNIISPYSNYEFKPNNAITKEEAINILLKFYGIDLVVNNEDFKNEKLTYNELENMMSMIFNKSDFSWEIYEKKLIYEKNIRAKSLDSRLNYITRAEFSFILYNLYD